MLYVTHKAMTQGRLRGRDTLDQLPKASQTVWMWFQCVPKSSYGWKLDAHGGDAEGGRDL
jgi:hypothetical protein